MKLFDGFFRFKFSEPDPTAAPTIAKAGSDPVFNLLVAGPKRSGKTVFLSALYHQMNAPDFTRNGYYMEIDDEPKHISLINSFNQIRDPQGGWPLPNQETFEYTFRCKTINNGNTYSLFEFKYLDFPGGYITSPRLADDINVKTKIKESHSVVFLIDGEKILLRLIGGEDAGFTIDDDLADIAPLVLACDNRPVQFVITKWDLLTSTDLSRVKDLLFRNDRFRNAVQLRERSPTPTSFIPVSAVGNGFARFDKIDRKIVKNKGAYAKPYNLDTTLAFAITDALLEELRGNYNTKLWSIIFNGGQWFADAASKIIYFAKEYGYDLRVLIPILPNSISDAITEGVSRGVTSLEDAIRIRREKMVNRETALVEVIRIQKDVRANFSRNPDWR